MMKKLPKAVLGFLILLAIAAGCRVPLGMAVRWGSLPVKNDDWRSRTSLLPLETVTDICSKFDKESSTPQCRTKTGLYAPDLFPLIEDFFLSRESFTYEDVQAMLGPYQAEYEPPVILGTDVEYSVSWYDLHGDRVTAIVFFFRGDGRIDKIKYHLGDQLQ